MKPHWTQPSHPDTLEVVSQPGSFAAYSKAKAPFAPGALLARLSAPTLTLSERAYSSVQVGRTANIELNSDFLYINHSCEPNLEFHVLNSAQLSTTTTTTQPDPTHHPVVIEIRAATRFHPDGRERGITAGEQLTFFYPSTEWDMAQAFECHCKTGSCKGLIRGSRYLDRKVLQTYFVNEHVWALKKQQEDEESAATASGGWSGTLASGGSASPPPSDL